MMTTLKRFPGNPIILPNAENSWESEAAFNGNPIVADDAIHILYRAMGKPQTVGGTTLELSTIGHAISFDRIQFLNRKQLIIPEHDWETYGCEDPRVTKMGDSYYIFYTALAQWPPAPAGITVAVAKTRDFQTIEEKHHVTPFNAKAMAMFPDKVAGKITVILTANTDLPPSKIAVAQVEDEKQLWDSKFWDHWYSDLDHYVVPLLRSLHDHIEVGAPPVKTDHGWLLIYSYIRNYRSSNKYFAIEAALLDINDPRKVIGRTEFPLLTPETPYELHGKIPNVIFPSGALVYNDNLGVYYGGADTNTCIATCKLSALLAEMLPAQNKKIFRQKIPVKKFSGNPIISPIPEHDWESKFTLNPAAIYEAGKVHIVYRAQGTDDTSVMGYAVSSDGLHIDERHPHPMYVPRTKFEMKAKPGFSGCEDPRITRVGDRIYMCYTAFNGVDPAAVAFTSIAPDDFVNKKWNWSTPITISPPGEFDKNACIFPEQIGGKYAFFHRLENSIWLDYVDDLTFKNGKVLRGASILGPREDRWDSLKVGIGPPPIKTADGWLLIYHGLSKEDNKYRLGAVLLDMTDPSKIIGHLDYPLLEPESLYQKKGLRPGTVFACGAVVMGEDIYIYYGAADQVTSVAIVPMEPLLKELRP